VKHLLIILSILLLFSLTIISCSEDKEESTTDTTAPVIAEVTAVTTPTMTAHQITLFHQPKQELSPWDSVTSPTSNQLKGVTF